MSEPWVSKLLICYVLLPSGYRAPPTTLNPVWPKYPNVLLCWRLRSCHDPRLILNSTRLSLGYRPYSSSVPVVEAEGQRGMDWKQLLTNTTDSVNEELRLRNAYLAVENRILHQQIKGRVPLSDRDRHALAKIGKKLGRPVIEEIATIAKPNTILAWHRTCIPQQGDRVELQKSLGRPRIAKEVEALVVRMAQGNRSWGYDRIVGALTHVG
jgi:hypothetical protein